jgi:hypothetical protein
LVKNNLFVGNSAGEDGGGAYLYTLDNTITVTNNTFTGNYARDRGAGVLVWMAWDVNSMGVLNNNISRGNSGSEDIVVKDTKSPYTTGYPVVLSNNDFSSFYSYCENRTGCSPAITESGNIDEYPLFVTGPAGDYYLSQIAAGQGADSPCVDAGDGLASTYALESLTTRTDEAGDTGIVDMGYHHQIAGFPGLSTIHLATPTHGSIL